MLVGSIYNILQIHGKITGIALVAKVAELVDALVLGASGATRESSSLSFRTILVSVRVMNHK